MAKQQEWERASEEMLKAGRSLGHACSMLDQAVAERLSLLPTAWECLSLLIEHGPVPAGRLAELTGLTTGSITGLVDRLQSAGYVRRQRDDGDRRRVMIELVPAALAQLKPLFEPMLKDMQRLHRRHGPEQLAFAVECLRDSSDVLRRHALLIRAETAEQQTGDGGAA